MSSRLVLSSWVRDVKRVIKEVVKLEKLVPGGQAIGDLTDGRKVFVWGALPGETALVRLTKLKKTHAEAIVAEIIKPSPDRIVPRDDCLPRPGRS